MCLPMLSGAPVLAGSEALPSTHLTICLVTPQDKERERERKRSMGVWCGFQSKDRLRISEPHNTRPPSLSYSLIVGEWLSMSPNIIIT